jgi:hypothetical protein
VQHDFNITTGMPPGFEGIDAFICIRLLRCPEWNTRTGLRHCLCAHGLQMLSKIAAGEADKPE